MCPRNRSFDSFSLVDNSSLVNIIFIYLQMVINVNELGILFGIHRLAVLHLSHCRSRCCSSRDRKVVSLTDGVRAITVAFWWMPSMGMGVRWLVTSLYFALTRRHHRATGNTVENKSAPRLASFYKYLVAIGPPTLELRNTMSCTTAQYQIIVDGYTEEAYQWNSSKDGKILLTSHICSCPPITLKCNAMDDGSMSNIENGNTEEALSMK